MMIFVQTLFYEYDEKINKAHDWESNPKIFKDFYCFLMPGRPWIINKISNQSLFIDTNLTATSLCGVGAVDNLAIGNTIGEAKETRGKYRKYTNEERFKIREFAS